MLKIKNWVVEEKKHVRFCHDWNDKEVFTCEELVCYAFSVVTGPALIGRIPICTIKKSPRLMQ